MKYEIGFGHKLFDGTEPEIKTYESLEEWTDTSAFIVEKPEDEAFKTADEAYEALSHIIEYEKGVCEEDGLYWWTIDYTDGIEYSEPVDTMVYIHQNGMWTKIE